MAQPFGSDEPAAREDDVVNRRRAWYWGKRYRLVVWIVGIITFFWIIRLLIPGGDTSWTSTITDPWEALQPILTNPSMLLYAIIFPLFFIMNFVILLGPMMLMGITQMQGFEPGDAEWGVKLDDVRGQAEAKEEVRRVVSIWQSGEAFEAAGGKRERGLLFLGAPGTGKTMLSKAIATGFNCPFVSMPGSGFAQTFMGMDVIIVRYLAWKAKKLARKWGGQCIVFIDEIDAVGRGVPHWATEGWAASQRRCRRRSRTSRSTAATARSPPQATSCSRPAPGGRGSSPIACLSDARAHSAGSAQSSTRRFPGR